MARKRMFSRKITESDVFCDMPLSAQALYFHICMEADDDGFVGGVKGIRRRVGASEDDFKLLVAKRFLLPFESGVVVVRQWLVHNTLRADRYTPTEYTREAALLVIQRSGPEKGAYEVALSPLEQAAGTLTPSDGTLTGENVTSALNGNQTATNGIPMVAVRLRYRDRLRTDDSKESYRTTVNPEIVNNTYVGEGARACAREADTPTRDFTRPPTVDEVAVYAAAEGHPDFNAARFVQVYSRRGWKTNVGAPVGNWRAKVLEWIDQDAMLAPRATEAGNPALNYRQRDYEEGDFGNGFFVDLSKYTDA